MIAKTDSGFIPPEKGTHMAAIAFSPTREGKLWMNIYSGNDTILSIRFSRSEIAGLIAQLKVELDDLDRVDDSEYGDD